MKQWNMPQLDELEVRNTQMNATNGQKVDGSYVGSGTNGEFSWNTYSGPCDTWMDTNHDGKCDYCGEDYAPNHAPKTN